MTILKPNISIKNRFALLRHIGSGGFSEVWLANDLLAEKHVVLKFFATQIGMSDPGMEMFKKEFKVNDVLTDHPNVLRVNYIDELENRPFLIMPLCRDGSLGDVLLRNKESGSTMDDKTLYEALLQIARGLQHLHAHDVLHLDIKPDNVLIDGPVYKLADFGISSSLKTKLTRMGTETGISPAYAAPERFQAKPRALKASDVFSFGVLITELVTGELPWMGMGGKALDGFAEVPDLSGLCSVKIVRLQKACLELNPDERPVMSEIVRLLDDNSHDPVENPRRTVPMSENRQRSSPSSEDRRRTARMPESQQNTTPITDNENDLIGTGKKKKKRSGGFFVLIGAIVLALLGLGYVLFYRPSVSAKQEISQTTPVPIVLPQPVEETQTENKPAPAKPVMDYENVRSKLFKLVDGQQNAEDRIANSSNLLKTMFEDNGVVELHASVGNKTLLMEKQEASVYVRKLATSSMVSDIRIIYIETGNNQKIKLLKLREIKK